MKCRHDLWLDIKSHDARALVGASLLAIAVDQQHQCRQTPRHREQARSHKGIISP